jgi:glutamate transport system substrate-binding protein
MNFATTFAFSGLLGCLVAATATPSSANPVFEPGTTMARIQEAGKLRVGTRFDAPAVALKNPITGEMEGFDVGLAKAIAKRLGLTEGQIEFTEVISANRETALSQDLIDINISGYVVNDKRRAVVGQVGPYISVSTRLFINEANAGRFKTVEDMKGMTICSPPTSSSIPFIKKFGATLIPINDNSVCLQQISNGQVEGTLSNDLYSVGFLSQYPGLIISDLPPFTKEGWGVGYKKDDATFCVFLRDTVVDFIDSGEWKASWDSSFGKLGLDLQVPPRPDDRC